MLLVPPLILLVAIMIVSSVSRSDGRMRPVLSVLTVLLVLSVAPMIYFGYSIWTLHRRAIGDDDARQQWARHATQYRSAEVLFKKHEVREFPLPQQFKALSMDGNVSIEREDETRLTTFILDQWGIDHSIAI